MVPRSVAVAIRRARRAAGQLAYRKEPADLTVRLRPIFFIGIGRIRLITGPYELTSEVIYNSSAKPQSGARMAETDPAYWVWEEIKLDCPYHISFKPLIPITVGVRWNTEFCKEFGLQEDVWRNLIQVELSEKQINKLAKELNKLNT